MNSSTFSVRVARKSMVAVDICTFELVSADGMPLPAFSAGSHIDVHVSDGIARQYSLCNDPAESHRYLIAVLKDPATRGGSKAMHEAVNEGDVIRISAPKNHFQLAHEAKRSLLMAGGIGVTPILCMAERLAIASSDFEMHYCARSRDRMAFHDRIRQSAFSSRVAFHFDDGEPSQKLDIASLLAAPSPGTHLYVCGPKGFMDAVLATAHALGWPEAQVHYEFFSAEVKSSETDGSFDIKLASSGRVVSGGNSCLSFSARSMLGIRFSGTKYMLRQSPSGHLLSLVRVPVSVPSSNGTRAMTATSISAHAGNNSSSGL